VPSSVAACEAHAFDWHRAVEVLEADASCDPPQPYTAAVPLSDAHLRRLTLAAAEVAARHQKHGRSATAEAVVAAATTALEATAKRREDKEDDGERRLRWVNGHKVDTPLRPRDRANKNNGDGDEPPPPSARARPLPAKPAYRETGMNTVCATPFVPWLFVFVSEVPKEMSLVPCLQLTPSCS